jgi:hypothetical protein
VIKLDIYEPVQVYEGDGINRVPDINLSTIISGSKFGKGWNLSALCQVKRGKIEEFFPFLFDYVTGDSDGLRIENGIIYFDKPYTACIQSEIEMSTDTIGSEIFLSLFDSINQKHVGQGLVYKFFTNRGEKLHTLARVTGDVGSYSLGFYKKEYLCSEFNICGSSHLRIDYAPR